MYILKRQLFPFKKFQILSSNTFDTPHLHPGWLVRQSVCLQVLHVNTDLLQWNISRHEDKTRLWEVTQWSHYDHQQLLEVSVGHPT